MSQETSGRRIALQRGHGHRHFAGPAYVGYANRFSFMEETCRLVSVRTQDLDEADRAAIVRVCIAAHDNPDFQRLFSCLPLVGLHVLGYSGTQLVSHAVVTTRWLQPEGMALLKSAYTEYPNYHIL